MKVRLSSVLFVLHAVRGSDARLVKSTPTVPAVKSMPAVPQVTNTPTSKSAHIVLDVRNNTPTLKSAHIVPNATNHTPSLRMVKSTFTEPTMLVGGTRKVAKVAKGHSKGGIIPPIEDVASAKKFFGPPFPADYPHDFQPKADKSMFKKGHPYPKVQEQGFFDRDYVKDENGDGGEWQAQMDYDTARTRIDRVNHRKKQTEKEAESGQKHFEDAAHRYQEKKEAERKAAEAAEEAGKKAEEKEQKQNEAERRAQEEAEEQAARRKAAHEAATSAKKAAEAAEEARKALEKKVADAENALAKEREGFKSCQKDLDAAKGKVEILKQQIDTLKSTGADESALLIREKKMMEEQKRLLREEEVKTKLAEAKRDAALAKLAATRNETEKALKKLTEEKEEYDAAAARADKKAKDLSEAEEDLGNATEHLGEARGKEALPPGAHYPPKSGASLGAIPVGRLHATLLLVAAISHAVL